MPEKNPSEFATIIGPDAVLKGELAFESGLRVEGTFEGKIRTKGTVSISGKGKVKGEIDAGQVIVEGGIDGNVAAHDRLELRETAKLHGDVQAAKLLVAEGAALSGQCHVGPDVSRGESGTSRAGERTPPREITPAAPAPPMPPPRPEVVVRK
ncbi:MAG TPA: polymer-forming cytoskeletal protein [Planctomycetota bacterium]|jgi:cytoskeletal protein CcmA (bactofilin family)|nr:polymer-forming cytoskeletal protein [Planctomycetota bacterium]